MLDKNPPDVRLALVEDPITGETENQVRSPFARSSASVESQRPAFSRKGILWAGVIVLALAVAGAVAVKSSGVFFNPLRVLREFPVQEYYENHATLEGTRFRGKLTITSQIGWKENLGRLVNCTLGDGKSPVVVLIPQKYDSTPMETGEHFEAELLVSDGGLIKVNFLRSN